MIIIKSPEDIKKLKKACKISADVLQYAGEQINAGMSTYELDKLIYDFIVAAGAKPSFLGYGGFRGSACISINDEVIHGIPSKKRVVKDGDIVSLDVGIDLNGYISDSCHSVLVGNVKPEIRKLDEVTLECLQAGIAACKAGNRISDISKAVYEIAVKHGYGVVYDYCGHGVGLDVHEDPSVPNCPSHGPNPRIQPGMVLAIEPMINLGCAEVHTAADGWTVLTDDGKWSAHEEHTVAVFEDHTEILTDLNYKK